MRVAIVSDYFFDYVGGAQTSMRQQVLALEQAGHSVILVSPGRSVAGPGYRLSGGNLQIRPLFRLPVLDLGVIANTARGVARFESFLRTEAVDVVHVQTEFGLAHLAARAAENLRIPLVHTVHSFYWASEGPPQASVAWLVRWCLQRVTGQTLPRFALTTRQSDNVLRNLVLAMCYRAKQVVSPSSHQAADLAAAGVSAQMSVIPNPIATATVQSSPLTLEQATDPKFLWVARCEPAKRPLPFARAAIAALARTGNGFTVDFVGEGSELASLRKLVAGHPKIRVLGAISHDEVLNLMDTSAIIALTSHGFDNQPMTIAEAVSRARGVLYCDPALTEGLQNSGHLTETADVSGLADAIVALVQNPGRLVQLSEGTLIDQELFSPSAYVARITEVYLR